MDDAWILHRNRAAVDPCERRRARVGPAPARGAGRTPLPAGEPRTNARPDGAAVAETRFL